MEYIIIFQKNFVQGMMKIYNKTKINGIIKYKTPHNKNLKLYQIWILIYKKIIFRNCNQVKQK